MKYRLAGASYRSIAAKLTEDQANTYADANGISFERAMKKFPPRSPQDPPLTRGLTDGSARAEGDVGEEGRVGFRGFVGAAVPESRGVGHSACL